MTKPNIELQEQNGKLTATPNDGWELVLLKERVPLHVKALQDASPHAQWFIIPEKREGVTFDLKPVQDEPGMFVLERLQEFESRLQTRFAVAFTVDGKETAPIPLKVRIPLGLAPVDRPPRPNDILVTPEVCGRSPDPQNCFDAKLVAQKIVETRAQIIWICGGIASGKSTFLRDLEDNLKQLPTCRIVRLKSLHNLLTDGKKVTKEDTTEDGNEVASPKVKHYVRKLIQDPNENCLLGTSEGQVPEPMEKEALAKWLNEHQVPHTALFFDEFDVFAERFHDRSKDASLPNTVKEVFDYLVELIKPKGDLITLVVADHMSASERLGDKYLEGLRVMEYETRRRFSMAQLKEIVEKLLLPNAVSIADLVDRIWLWTRGHPLLVNALLAEYVKGIIEGKESSIDTMVRGENLRQSLEYIVGTALKGADLPLSHKRLSASEPNTLTVVAQARNRGKLCPPYKSPADAPYASLEAKGLISIESVGGKRVAKVDIPLLRCYLLDPKSFTTSNP